MQFRRDSMLGVAGAPQRSPVPATSRSRTRWATAWADDKLVYTYVPTSSRYYLREKPVLGNVDTYRSVARVDAKKCSTASTNS